MIVGLEVFQFDGQNMTLSVEEIGLLATGCGDVGKMRNRMITFCCEPEDISYA